MPMYANLLVDRQAFIDVPQKDLQISKGFQKNPKGFTSFH